MIDYNQQLQDIMDNSTSVIVVKEKEGKYIFVNKQYEDVVQRPKEEILGKNDYMLWNKDMADSFIERDREVLLTDKSLLYEEKIHQKDGILYILLNRFPLKDSNGKIYALGVIGTDITESRKKEKRIYHLSEELKQTNEDLENFIYTASHDLKHPISNLEGLLTVLNETEYRQEERSVLQMMNDSIEKLKKSISLLEDMSHITFKSSKDTKNIRFSDLTKQVISSLKKRIEDTGVVITTDFHACETIYFSEESLLIILTNLIDNAINFQDGDRGLHIDVKTKKRKDGTIIISVEDDGLGVELDKIDKVFSMIKRMHTHADGMGLGLYIVRRIVESYGGSIEVESERGKGSTYKVFLKN